MFNRMTPAIIAICNVFGLSVAVSDVRADIPQGQTSPVVGNLRVTDASVLVQQSDDEVNVEDLKVGALQRDDVVTNANFTRHGEVISADHTKRLYVSFSVKRRVSGTLIQPHQAFVLFKHANGSEVFYKADVQTDGTHLVDINLARAHEDFKGISGTYTAYLIIGDATIRTPADFMLTLPSAPVEVVPKSQRINYDVLPEIKHAFRQPEKRPPTIVSDTFTLICSAPLLLLLVLWFRIGLNFGNMPLSLWTLIFHGSLTALFALYFVFWLQLNMFGTLKYLAVVGSLTYFAGNRVLRAVAEKRK
ncbi:hypothetical protein OSTOST_15597 [Ostertagia ostertagi]